VPYAPRPQWQIKADGIDITSRLISRLISLTITDAAGIEADTFSITLADPHDEIEIPRSNATIEIALGYDDKLTPMGRYRVAEIRWEQGKLTFSGDACDFAESLISQKKRSWPAVPSGGSFAEKSSGMQFGDFLRQIAAEHALTVKIHPSLDGIHIKHIDQSYESDINIITRVAAEIGATIKPTNGLLIAVPRGSGEDASGKALQRKIIESNTIVGSPSWRSTARSRFRRVGALYADKRRNTTGPVYAGSGEPVVFLRGNYSDINRARRAAESELKRLNLGRERLSLRCVGDATLAAELPVTWQTRPGIAAEWIIERVQHSVSRSGFVSVMDLVRPAKVEQPQPEPVYDDHGDLPQPVSGINLMAYYKERHKQFNYLLTPTIENNASVTVAAANQLLALMAADGVNISQARCNSGWRPKPVNDKLRPRSSPNSPHITAQAIDISDRSGIMHAWAMANPDKVRACGFVAIEKREYSKTWLHLSTRGLLSGQQSKALLTWARGRWLDWRERA